jgi:xanthine dehydrogenase accessory factor
MAGIVLVRGGGDTATGVAVRLVHAGFRVIITELPRPLAVRRSVAFAEAVYEGTWTVEKIPARRVQRAAEISSSLESGEVPVLVDPELGILREAMNPGLLFEAMVDGRLTKLPPGTSPPPFGFDGATEREGRPVLIGLGPGFNAGIDCDAVVETMRGHTLGRVYWQGGAITDTNKPEGDPRRVLRAPIGGTLQAHAEIGQRVEAGQILAEVRAAGAARYITSPFTGILRGMIRSGSEVVADLKIGDVDARNDPSVCFLVSDKSLAVGGGVLEAILAWSSPDARAKRRVPGAAN